MNVTQGSPSLDQESSDEQLMSLYQQGNADAFTRLYQRYKNMTFRYLLRQTDRLSTAEELHQDLWMKLVKNNQQWQGKSNFKTYLFTIARNNLVDYFRKHGRDEILEANEDCGESGGDLSVLLNNEQALQQLDQLIRNLPPKQRDAFLLKNEAGFSVEDIGIIVGESGEAVKSQVRYALNNLRRGLAAYV